MYSVYCVIILLVKFYSQLNSIDISTCFMYLFHFLKTFKALSPSSCSDVQLRNYSITDPHSQFHRIDDSRN